MYKFLDEILPASSGFFVAQVKFIQGAHQSILNTGSFDQIGSFVLTTGMRVFVVDDERYYQYDGANWLAKEKYNYTHIQSIATSSWIISHNMGYRPNVYTVNGINEQVVGQIIHQDTNNLSVNFSLSISGTAWLS